jgi:molybdate transport system substrate-binding protein
LAEVAAAWRQRSGAKVVFGSVGSVEVAKRVHDGEKFDVVALAADAIDKLVAAGRVVAGSKTDSAGSGVAIAVRRGAAQPAVDTEKKERKRDKPYLGRFAASMRSQGLVKRAAERAGLRGLVDAQAA